MKVLLQRVSHAHAMVDGQTVGAIDHGLLLFVGIEAHDTLEHIHKMADRVTRYRVFSDQNGRMNLNVMEANGGLLAISQFTLAAETQKGLRPGFSKAAAPDDAKNLYETFVEALGALHQPVAEGIFGADMKVHLVNDGPIRH